MSDTKILIFLKLCFACKFFTKVTKHGSVDHDIDAFIALFDQKYSKSINTMK